NRCLNARRAASRRPAREWDMSQFEAPVPTPRDEAVWLQPFPDAYLEGAADGPLGPEARYEQSEAISLAFVAALQLLPPRQLAVAGLGAPPAAAPAAPAGRPHLARRPWLPREGGGRHAGGDRPTGQQRPEPAPR